MTEAAKVTGTRLHFVQWLRVFLIALVVAHHAGQPYGPTGGSWPVSDPANSDLLLPFFAVNAAFFMGFFFLISGYFIEGSYDRHGPRAFLQSRLLRLGVPLVLIVVFLNGGIAHSDSQSQSGYFGFLWKDYIGGQMEFGPLWFIAHLLVYAVLYALWRLFMTATAAMQEPAVPGHLAVAAYTLALILATYLVRQVWPQDVWVRFLGFIPMEPMHMPQYASLFVIGIIASRGDWFRRVPKGLAYTWFWTAVVVFGLAAAMTSPGVDLPGGLTAEGFWRMIDSVICVGMILGLLVFFREHADHSGALSVRLAGSAYGVYLLHVYIVVGLQMAIVDMPLGPLTKFLVVTIAALILSFGLVDILRRIPAVRRLI